MTKLRQAEWAGRRIYRYRRVLGGVTASLLSHELCDNDVSGAVEQWEREGVAHPRRSVFQYTAFRGGGAKGARVCGINPGRIIRRRGELKLPYASACWINSPETFIHFNALLCRYVARNVICTIDCGAVYILVINVAFAPMDITKSEYKCCTRANRISPVSFSHKSVRHFEVDFLGL